MSKTYTNTHLMLLIYVLDVRLAWSIMHKMPLFIIAYMIESYFAFFSFFNAIENS